MVDLQALVGLLADGRFHSGQDLSQRLQVSRGTIWKMMSRLGAMGVEVDRVRGRGYRTAYPLEFLQSSLVQKHQEEARVPFELLFETDSTNRYLVAMAQTHPARKIHGCFAEYQTAGRGRRGRSWVSPLAANLYGSVLRRFDSRPAALEGVSLVTAIAVLRALQDLGISEAGIKWPNDIHARGRKLAGILLEMGGEPNGACYIVAGIGVNVRMPASAAQKIDQQWIDLAQLAGEVPISRNRLAGRLLTRLSEAYTRFERDGLDAFKADWARFDLTYQREVRIDTGTSVVYGTSIGVDAHGALLLEHNGQVQRYFSGDVSLRLEQGTPS